MPLHKNNAPYERWDVRKERKPKKPVNSQPICRFCGGPIKPKRSFCSRSCWGKFQIRAIQTWEQAVAKNLESDGWTIIKPSACCDRIGIKDGNVFFLEFKPAGRTKLRTYQKIIRDLVPHMYRVVVGNWGEDVGIDKIKGSWSTGPKRQWKQSGSTSRFTGVYLESRSRKWIAKIEVNGKRVRVGQYATETEAATAYDQASIRYFGIPKNFPDMHA